MRYVWLMVVVVVPCLACGSVSLPGCRAGGPNHSNTMQHWPRTMGAAVLLEETMEELNMGGASPMPAFPCPGTVGRAGGQAAVSILYQRTLDPQV